MSQSLAVRPTWDAVTIARVREIVEQLTARDRSGEILTAVHHIPAREAKFAPMPEWIRDELASVYGEKGVGQLYSHQAAAAAA
jgi:DEAD/DEAH box helicase domain-containing protein